MPYVDPWGGFKQGTNALAGAAEMAQRGRLAGERNQLFREGLGLKQRGLDMEQSKMDQQWQLKKMVFAAKLLDTVKDEASYQKARTFWIQQFGDDGTVPPVYDPAWVKQQKSLIPKEFSSAAGIGIYEKGTGKVTTPAPAKTPTTAMAKFIQDNPNATPDEIAMYAQKLKGKGIKVTLADGSVVEVGGKAGDTGLAKKTQGAIEEKLLGGKEQLARMQTIVSEFKPEYQEIGTRLNAAWTGIKAKFGKDVDPEDAKALTDFKKYQRKSIENINLYIKEMTGAQMSEKEASRLRLAQPDPGEHWWQGDDPITFISKAKDVIKFTRAAIARFEYYRSKGLSDGEITGLINSNKAVSLESIASKMK